MSDQEIMNNLLATGATQMALMMSSGYGHALQSAHTVADEKGPTNVIEVTFEFLNSPYRLTVERVRDSE